MSDAKWYNNMYLFIIKYQHVSNEDRRRVMALQINNKCVTNEHEAYLNAVNLAYENMEQNEFLASVKLIRET